jgi:predicted nucleic acid-binding protein
MENRKVVLCDTNILIEFYKGNPDIVATLRKIGLENICFSVVTSGEIIYGALNKRELQKIKKDLAHLTIINIDDEICNKFIDLMSNYSLSHNLTLPDALIAATAITKDF